MGMEEEKNEEEVVDDVMLPGFRFHPTDEELVGFYLKRKIQQRPISIELIRQLDIYKYDPWDLPKLATSGEKEWYFYCPRDRKYRNSTRPNRVTGAGFWKATGTDRPIYSANATKCIGLKKSLVFYKGRAAKGLKTDWMMHEFRLPPGPPIATNIIPPSDSWAICRIFKKTNTSGAQRAVSCSLPTTNSTSIVPPKDEILLYKNELVLPFKTTPDEPACNLASSYGYEAFNYSEGKLPQLSIPSEAFDPPTSFFTFPPMEASDIAKSALDVSSILLNMSSSDLGHFGCSSRAAQSSDPLLHGQSHPSLPHQMQYYDQDNALLETVLSSSIGCPLTSIWDNFIE